ncbi:hypothetical protein QZR43_06285 [Serratia marcescens]|uniref:hypothetical protein n=1 Tax=Serratia marcescens TaxID=615 RepID=UPI0027754821|nr:hypothetical protein [Serratia marcescens]MDP8772193.1 hypothetical protein [Serratia marcescens]MDP8802598.1 hypothetical protein [Serratia marcescens]
MELIDIFALFSCVLLVVCGLYYGAAFVRRKNYLLGVEFLIVGISATNFTTFIATGWQTNYDVAIFLDAFSRGVGVPIVGTLGLMAVTHGYKPSPAKDFILFLAAFSVTAIYFLSTAFKPWLPYFYVLMWALYTLYLLYFIWCLARAGEFLHALATLLGGGAGGTIALKYDFFPILGDGTKMVFMTCAFLTWSYMMAQLFYAYCALQRSMKTSTHTMVHSR